MVYIISWVLVLSMMLFVAWLSKNKKGVRVRSCVVGVLNILLGVAGLIPGSSGQSHKLVAPMERPMAKLAFIILICIGIYICYQSLFNRGNDCNRKPKKA